MQNSFPRNLSGTKTLYKLALEVKLVQTGITWRLQPENRVTL